MYVWACFMLLSAFCAQAQVDSVRLDSVVVSLRGEQKLNQIKEVDRMNVRNVGDALTQRSTVLVKPNSGNSLATLSIRGGTAEQSAVYWNGLSLQNTLNGNLDLSLLPTEAFSSMELNGVNSASIGSGAINGSLHLKNSSGPDTNWLELQGGYGSFGQINGHVRLNKTVNGGDHRLLVYHNQAENNYPYQVDNFFWGVLNGGTLEHSGFSSQGALYTLKHAVKNNNPLNIRLWWQQANRQIPNSIVEGPSRKYQQDASLRFQSDWSKQIGKNTVRLNVGSFYEQLGYQDSASKIYSDYGFYNQSVLLHLKRNASKKFKFGFDLETRHFHGNADTFYDVGRLETAQAIHGQYKHNTTKLQASLRAVQYINQSDKPVLYTVQVEQRLNAAITALVKFSSNYRMPTFNSLYWVPGGNPDLVSEESTNLDLNFLYTSKAWNARISVYDYVITNQITWLPGSQGYFEATQVVDQQQWNRGVEGALNYERKQWRAYMNLSALKSTVRYDSLKPWEGDQQQFVPHFQGNAGIQFNRKWFSIGYQVWAMSSRGQDHLGWPPDFTGITSQSFAIHGVNADVDIKGIHLNIQLNNLWNTYYFILPYRPNMPRNYQFSIRHYLHKKETK